MLCEVKEKEKPLSLSHSKGLTLNKLDTLSHGHYVFGICKCPIYHLTVFSPYSPPSLLNVLLKNLTVGKTLNVTFSGRLKHSVNEVRELTFL